MEAVEGFELLAPVVRLAEQPIQGFLVLEKNRHRSLDRTGNLSRRIHLHSIFSDLFMSE